MMKVPDNIAAENYRFFVIINYFVRSTDRAETELKRANLNLSKKNDQIQETLKQRDKALAALDRELSDAADYVRTTLPAPMSRGNIRTEWRSSHPTR